MYIDLDPYMFAHRELNEVFHSLSFTIILNQFHLYLYLKQQDVPIVHST